MGCQCYNVAFLIWINLYSTVVVPGYSLVCFKVLYKVRLIFTSLMVTFSRYLSSHFGPWIPKEQILLRAVYMNTDFISNLSSTYILIRCLYNISTGLDMEFQVWWILKMKIWCKNLNTFPLYKHISTLKTKKKINNYDPLTGSPYLSLSQFSK